MTPIIAPVRRNTSVSGAIVPLLFSLTLFVSALLLFLVQPMVGKMLLPKLGGTPAVWNTCLVFFQAALLAGYAYAHVTTRLGAKRQSVPHLVVLALPLLVLPIALGGDDAFLAAAASANPVWLVLKQLTLGVGLPFFVVATTAPLVQRWFADTGSSSAKDPYFLYAASNLGSMIGMLAYPFVIEPLLTLDGQSRVWAWGYGVCAGLVAACAATLWFRARPTLAVETPAPAEPLTWPRRIRWVALAFVPSSLLLGVTTYISTDIAPIPLLWIVPLALYLLTFILVFAKRPPLPHRLINRLMPVAVLMLTLVLLTGATEMRGLPVWVLLAIHLLAFFLAAMVAHGELARDRPGAGRLTEFYLWLSVGGVLGGMFNALIAPIVFHKTGLTEYPLALVLACLLRSVRTESAGARERGGVGDIPSPTPPRSRAPVLDLLLPVAVGAVAVGMIYLSEYLKLGEGPLRTGLAFGLPCVVVFTFVDRPLRFGFGVGALLLAGAVNPSERKLFLERNYFGVVKVADVSGPEGGRFRALFHGNTIHGQMDLERTDADGRREPLTYYHRSGPIGKLCTQWFEGRPDGQRVAGIGLGTGSLAYYARPGDRWLFYEIDPAIQRIAEDPNYFLFLAECRAGPPAVILGDAYLRLQEAPEDSFDLMILDAFSSDSIPLHLLTREALALYRSRLKPGGVLAFHVSNRYLNLHPILGRLADDAGWVARYWYDPGEDRSTGKSASKWVIMAAREEDFGKAVWPRGTDKLANPMWMRIMPDPDVPLWTSNFSNLLSAFGGDEE